jgi:hypothetical protein
VDEESSLYGASSTRRRRSSRNRRGRDGGRPSQHENLQSEECVLGHQFRARPNGVEGGGAGECGRGANGSEQGLDDLAHSVNHQPEFAIHCITEAADRALADGALAMARTTIDLVTEENARTYLLR